MEKKGQGRHGMPKKEVYMAYYQERNQALAWALATKKLKEQRNGVISEPEVRALTEALLKDTAALLEEAYKPENRHEVVTAAVTEVNTRTAGPLYSYATLAAYLEQRNAKAGHPITHEEKKEILEPMRSRYDPTKESWQQFLSRCMTVINARRSGANKLRGTRRIANYFSNISCYQKRRAAIEAAFAGPAGSSAQQNNEDNAALNQRVQEALDEKRRLEQQIVQLKQQLLAAATPKPRVIESVDNEEASDIIQIKQEMQSNANLNTTVAPEADVAESKYQLAKQSPTQLVQA